MMPKHSAIALTSLVLSLAFPVLAQAGEILEDFFSAAILSSPRLQIAEERLKISSARKDVATGGLLPQLNANANLSNNRRDSFNQLQTFNGERYSLQLSQVLFNWQAFSARKQARFSEDQYEAEYYGELASLLTEVAEKYFAVLQAVDAVNSAQSEVDAVSNQLAQIQSLYDRQLSQITDLYQAQASLAAAQGERLQLQSELTILREALRSISGISVGELFSLSDTAVVPTLENSINYWVGQAQQNNHQIQAREYAVKAAESGLAASRGAYMPRVSLIAQRQSTDLGFDNAPIYLTDNTYIGVDISIPLFAGGSNRARVREATSQQRIAENELRQVQLEAGERVRAAYLQVQSGETLIAAALQLVDSTALSSTAMQRGFELGTVTSVDVLNALRDQFQAERALQESRYEQVNAFLRLKREAGLLTADDMLEVSSWLEAPDA